MNKEHTIAVFEPSLDDDSAVEIARETVASGGDATILVLVGPVTMENASAFSKSENLAPSDGRAIYFERLADNFSERSGAHVKLISDGPRAQRFVFDAVAREHATSIVVPQRLARRRNWKSAVAKSRIPVLLAPPKAA